MAPYGSPSGIKQEFGGWTLRARGVKDLDFISVPRGGLRSPQGSVGAGRPDLHVGRLFFLCPPIAFPYLCCFPALFGLMAPGLSTEMLHLLFGGAGGSLVMSDLKRELSVSSCPGFWLFCDSS